MRSVGTEPVHCGVGATVARGWRISPPKTLSGLASGMFLLLVAACGHPEQAAPSGPSAEPAAIAKAAGDEQHGPPGTLLPSSLEVVVTGPSGEPVQGADVSFTATGGTVVPARGPTDRDGRRSARLLLPDGEGPVEVTASTGTLPSVRFTAEAVRGKPNPYTYPLHISGRYLVDDDGRPVILIGDSPWSLVVQLDSAEVKTYLTTRVSQGVNAILFNGIEHLFADDAPRTAYGRPPFRDTLASGSADFTTLDDGYWSWVEWVVGQARDRGITCLIAPAYLGFHLGNQGWATEVAANGPKRMAAYGDSLGRRFGSYGNVVWVMGGDSGPAFSGTDVTAEVNALADGMASRMPDAIFSAHGSRYSSALDAYDQSWLDINSTYSDPDRGPSQLETDYGRTDGNGASPMPSIWIEGFYENEHGTTPAELRSQMYWSLLSGDAGSFYGNHPVWPFGAAAASGFGDSSAPPYDTWPHAMETDVARDLIEVRHLVDRQPMRLLVPDFGEDVVTGGRGSGATYAAAARASDGSLIIAYLPDRREVTVDMSAITTDTVATASWLDPRTGSETRIGRFPTEGHRGFMPPSDADWILVVEDLPD